MSIRELVLRSWQQANLLTVFLWPLSLVYRLLFAFNKTLYSVGLKSAYRAPVPVIVVGNLTVGGTGKTPMVIYLVEQLRARGYSPGVISRGYLASANGGAVTVSVTVDTPIAQSGDEAAMIVRPTQVPMVVSSNRRAACEKLLSHSSVDIIISDDGLQHHALARDVEICLLDETTKQTNYFLLPAGPYRESLARLDSIDLQVIHKPSTQQLNRQSNEHESSPNDGQFIMHLRASQPSPLDEHSGQFNADKTTHAVAGIANPQRFFDTCRSLGYTIEEHAFADHHPFSEGDLDFGVNTQVLMTEKDAIKCANFNNSGRWFLPVEAKLGIGFVHALIEKLN